MQAQGYRPTPWVAGSDCELAVCGACLQFLGLGAAVKEKKRCIQASDRVGVCIPLETRGMQTFLR